MKTKSIILCLIVLSAFKAGAQLKVDQFGRIGMGTAYPNPGYKCHIKGNLLLTTYPANPFIEFQFKVGNGWPGTEIGSSVDQIAFWSSYIGYHKLYAEEYFKLSDASYKINSGQIVSPIYKLKLLKPYKYDYKNYYINENGDSLIELIPQYGFISQEVEKSLTEVKITTDGKDGKLMDYDQIIPLLVAGIQEQQLLIDSLENELREVKSKIINLNQTTSNSLNNSNVLYQNAPNPFNERTTISFSLDEKNFRSATIAIFDMNGILIKQYPIKEAGNGSIEINANELKAGMYIYTLIVNQKEIDTKRMILLN